MLKQFFVLFLALSSALHAEDYLLAGVDLSESTGYYDFDKSAITGKGTYDKDGVDLELCWAYTAANMLQYWQDKQSSSYISANAIPNGDSLDDGYDSDIVAAYIAVWKNIPGYEFDALAWWLTDTSGVYQSYDNKEDLYPEGGGYWSEYFTDVSSIYTWTTVSSTSSALFIDTMGAAISSDSAMALTITTSDAKYNYVHVISLWGYGVDEDGHYYLYLTDSDDVYYGYDGMVKVNIYYDDATTSWYLEDYYGLDYDDLGYDSDWKISRITTLDVGVLSLTVPEPSAVTLALLALAGLYRRRRKAA